MYKKFIVAALVLTSISISAYAAEGKGYREYGEEYHSTPGFNFHVKEVPIGTGEALAQKKNFGAATEDARHASQAKAGK